MKCEVRKLFDEKSNISSQVLIYLYRRTLERSWHRSGGAGAELGPRLSDPRLEHDHLGKSGKKSSDTCFRGFDPRSSLRKRILASAVLLATFWTHPALNKSLLTDAYISTNMPQGGPFSPRHLPPRCPTPHRLLQGPRREYRPTHSRSPQITWSIKTTTTWRKGWTTPMVSR